LSTPDPTHWHALTPETVLLRLGVTRGGLDPAEASARRARFGPNAFQEAPPVRPLAILGRQFRSFLVGLLVVASILSLFLGDRIDAAAILAIVVLNAGIGFAQEWRAERSIAALRRLTAPRARVRRAGRVIAVDATELLPGDIVLLEAGDLVPADLRLLDSSALRCSESALTGESEPVDKDAQALRPADTALGERSNLAHLGTSVVAGVGSGVVFATGMDSQLGGIARLLASASEQDTETPLEQRLQALARTLAVVCLGSVLLVFVLGALRGLPLAELLMTSISLAVASVPEGLPAVATVALTLGVARMARRRALIRRLAAVETLGSASVVCTDKTGTLTRGEMTVRELWTAGHSFQVSGEGYGPEGWIEGANYTYEGLARELLEVLASCNNAHLAQDAGVWQVLGDPTEGALLSAAAKLGVTQPAGPRLREWPFDSARKRMSTARKLADGRVRLDVKGAPESVLACCDRIADAEGVRALCRADLAQIAETEARLAARGLRVLGAAWREDHDVELASADPSTVERGLVFAGLVGMLDPPRVEARAAVARCRAAGIRVVMITGDHPRTGLAIARELDIAAEGEVALTGPELARLSDADLAERVPHVSVYARVTPEDKLRIVRAWQSRSAVVAMTGDGVNDAPALRAADIGIAMGRIGTEVAKQASDMIVTDDNFASIVAAVEEGRGIFANIRKTLQYLLAGNAAELVLMALCVGAGYPAPLLPVHLLWINLVTDGLPALCLATDSVDADVMRDPPRSRRASLTDRAFLGRVILTGVGTALLVAGVYIYALNTWGESAARSHAFGALVCTELLRAFSWRSERTPLWRMNLLGNGRLAGIVAVSLLLQLAIHGLAPLREVFHTEPLSASSLGLLLAVALLPVAVLELAKVLPLSARKEGLSPCPS